MNKQHSVYPEFEDRMSFFQWLRFNLAYPLEWSRQLWAEYGFKYWEDECADLVQAIQSISRLSFNKVLLSLIALLASWSVITNANRLTLPDFSGSESLIAENESIPSQKQSSELVLSNQLESRYQELKSMRTSSNLEVLDNLGKRLNIAFQLVQLKPDDNEPIGWLYASGIELSLECISGDLSIPSEVIEALLHRPNDSTITMEPRLETWTTMADIIVRIHGRTNKADEWQHIEQKFEELVSRNQNFEGQRHLVEKFIAISKTSNEFAQPNQLEAIYKASVEQKKTHTSNSTIGRKRL